jgi:hypothetical protein
MLSVEKIQDKTEVGRTIDRPPVEGQLPARPAVRAPMGLDGLRAADVRECRERPECGEPGQKAIRTVAARDGREAAPRAIVRVIERHGVRERRCDEEKEGGGLGSELHAWRLNVESLAVLKRWYEQGFL